MIITIDGPSGTGKSTIARLLAQKLKISFFDTGAMYRSLAFWALQEKIDIDQEKDWNKILRDFHFSIVHDKDAKKYFVNGTDVTDLIRTPEISQKASPIASIQDVRTYFLPVQREYAKNHDVVFEGRDLGTVVFPWADVKIFLTARPEVRGRRRYLEIKAKNPSINPSLEEITRELQKRDLQDESREAAPLKCPDDAWILDTSDFSVEEVVNIILKHIETKKNNAGLA